MGRPRTTGHELPKRVTFYHGAYYYHPKDGKRTWLGRTLTEAMTEWAKVAQSPASCNTMSGLFDRYLLEVTPTKAPLTQRDDARAMIPLRAGMGHLRPHEVDAGTAYDYLNHRSQQGAPVRANREVAVLRHVMTQAVKWKVVKANPLYRLEMNKEKPRTREILPGEVLAWYRVAGDLCGPYTALKLLTGLRKGDMLRLRKSQWGEYKGRLGLLTESSKTKKRLFFLATPALTRAVKRAIERCSNGSDFIFATRKGKSYAHPEKSTTSGFDSIWQRRMVAFAAAGHERFTEHDLRSKAGDDKEEVSGQGHKLLGNTETEFRRAYQRRTQVVEPVR
jgi:integrase